MLTYRTRLPGLKWGRTLWLASRAPFEYTGRELRDGPPTRAGRPLCAGSVPCVGVRAPGAIMSNNRVTRWPRIGLACCLCRLLGNVRTTFLT